MLWNIQGHKCFTTFYDELLRLQSIRYGSISNRSYFGRYDEQRPSIKGLQKNRKIQALGGWNRIDHCGSLLILFFCLRTQKLWLMFILNIVSIYVDLVIRVHDNAVCAAHDRMGLQVASPISDSFAIGILYSGATLGGALFGEI